MIFSKKTGHRTCTSPHCIDSPIVMACDMTRVEIARYVPAGQLKQLSWSEQHPRVWGISI